MRRFWTEHRAILAILGLALVLRLINLNARPLWYDEAFAVLYAERPIDQIVYGTVTPVEGSAAADVHPILYYLGLHGWIGLVGDSPFAVRFPSVVMGVAVVWLLGLLAHQAGGKRLKRYAMLVAALAPFPISYSQEARMYSLLALCGIGAAYSGWRSADDRRWWFAYGVFAALTLYAHNLGALTLIAINLWLLARLIHPFHLRRLIPWLSANLFGAILFSPWLVLVVPGQIDFVRHGYWVPTPKLAELVRSIIVYHFNLPLPDVLLPPSLFLALVVLCLLILQIVKVNAKVPLTFLWLGFSPLGLMWVISQWQPIYIDRAVLPAGLLYLVAVAWLFADAGSPRLLRIGLGAICLTVAALSLGYHYTYRNFPRGPFVEASAYLRDQVGEGDIVIHSNKLTFFPMHYYDRHLSTTWVADPAGDGSDTLARPTQEALQLFPQPDIEAAVGGAEGLWFVIFQQAINEYGGRHPHLVWLEEIYTMEERVRLDGLLLYHFVLPDHLSGYRRPSAPAPKPVHHKGGDMRPMGVENLIGPVGSWQTGSLGAAG
jgi:hypothetical protein